MVDFDALDAAGIANARGRAGLIEYLDGPGFTADEMVEAERRERLFGRAGDAVQRSGRPTHSLKTAADELAASVDDVATACAVLGLTVADLDEVALSQADVDGLATWGELKKLRGDDGALGFLRVLGAAMARLTEAESTVVRLGAPDLQINHSHDELVTAQAYRAVSEFVPRIGSLIEAVHRHHLSSARTYFEGVVRDSSANVVCAWASRICPASPR